MINRGFSRFEMVMGLGLLALLVLLVLPPMRAGLEDQQAEVVSNQARDLAYAVLDHLSETGEWPAALQEGNGAPLAGTLVHVNGGDGASEPPALDPWNQPFKVSIVGDLLARDPAGSASGYLAEPPAGCAIVVLSAGPDGHFQTDTETLWQPDLSGRLNLRVDRDEPPAGNGFSGDDLGFILTRTSLGESP